MKYNIIKELDNKHCIQNYGRYNVAFTHGRGSILYDSDNKGYIDFAAGIGVNSIGHSHPHWIKKVSEQLAKLAHVSNLYYTEPYAVLAERLTQYANMEKTFFCNSGAEANEAAIKLARKYSKDKYGDGRGTIITLNKSFHGRTIATLKATGQPDYHKYFDPFPEGFKYVEANDYEGLKQAITADVCAIIIEGIQGEGGVIPLEMDYVKSLASLANDNDILVIFDEVQTGIGRTGHMFSCEGFGVGPDLITTAKGLGGGLPIGALMANHKCSDVLTAGTHGSTFGGNPIACAGANAVLDIVLSDGFLDEVNAKGENIRNKVSDFGSQYIKEVRGKGLMIGIEIEGLNVKEVVVDLLKEGLVTLTAGSNVLRLLPPLTISEDDITEGLMIMQKYLIKKAQ